MNQRLTNSEEYLQFANEDLVTIDDSTFTFNSAGITFVGAGTLSTEGDNSGTTLSVTFPAHDAGDLLIAIIGLSNASTDPAQDCNAETGWTLMQRGFWNSFTAGRTCVYYNFDEDDSITTVEFDSDGTTGYVAKGFTYRGVDTENPIDVGPNFLDDQGSATTINHPDYTTVTDGAMGIVITNRDGGVVPLTHSLGYNERSDEGDSNPGDGDVIHMADLVHTSAGPQNPGAVSWSPGEENNAMTFALRPVPPIQVDEDGFYKVSYSMLFAGTNSRT